jgi:tetratricopeptide (TPR) repeat protein
MAGKRQPSGNSNHDWYENGRHLSRHGSHKEAIKALDAAIKENPLHAEAYFIRGACQYALGNYQDAGEDLDAAAILGCRDAQFWSKHSIPPLAIRTDDRQE